MGEKRKGNYKGRIAGSLNKNTQEARNILEAEFKALGFELPKQIVDAFAVADYERLDRLIKLMEYLFPKIAARLSLDMDNLTDDLNLNINLNNIMK